LIEDAFHEHKMDRSVAHGKQCDVQKINISLALRDRTCRSRVTSHTDGMRTLALSVQTSPKRSFSRISFLLIARDPKVVIARCASVLRSRMMHALRSPIDNASAYAINCTSGNVHQFCFAPKTRPKWRTIFACEDIPGRMTINSPFKMGELIVRKPLPPCDWGMI
jgi:hypothetical protein